MKIVFFNGSPRMKGNTRLLLKTIEEGIIANIPNAEITFYDVDHMSIKPCSACDGCKKNKGICVHKEDTNPTMKTILEADAIIFGSPVYWWGISAQLKTVIDKFYSFDGIAQSMNPKKVGIISVGADGLDSIQYRLISDQFSCITNHLGWPIVFDQKYSAWEVGAIAQNSQALEEASGLWKTFE